MPIGIVLADPHPIVLDGLNALFQNRSGFEVMSSVRDGDTALDALKNHHPDILLLELSLPKKDGFSLIQNIKELNIPTRVIVFTDTTIEHVLKVIDLGVDGLISKAKHCEQLTRCIKAVYDGKKWFDQDLMTQALTHKNRPTENDHCINKLLTAREVTVARLLTQGWTNKNIAKKLQISEGTTKLHLHHIYQKTNCSGRMGLFLLMQKNGLIQASSTPELIM